MELILGVFPVKPEISGLPFRQVQMYGVNNA